VQQNRLHLSGDLGVGGSNRDRERFVTAVDILRPFSPIALLSGHGLPKWRPFGARRAHDVLNAEIPEGVEEYFAAVSLVIQVQSSVVRSMQGTQVGALLDPGTEQAATGIPKMKTSHARNSKYRFTNGAQHSN
jgi:hypothetical protein